ncbi:MAG: alanyl-tRNA editing protein, partial [Tissierellia bacterium]|nr:alanyl-tRNA editing protein [Tissierellia bacterium]
MKLFEINPYLRTFTADVVEQTILEDRPAVVLSQTAFYPLGGGQEADRGKLNGIEVIDVIERQNKIYHILADDITESTVEGEIDWQRRYDHMQQHTGEHILSGLVLQRFGLNNVGFHIGQQLMRVDYDGFLDWPELLELERETNRVIGQNLTVVDDI